MKVLLLTQVLPYPPDSGPKVKTWNVIKYLKAAGHSVTLVSFVRGNQSADVAHLRQYCDAVFTVPMDRGPIQDGVALLRSLATQQPWMMLRDDRATMRDLVARVSSDTTFDIAHADQLNMAQYAAQVRGARKILDAHNALWVLYRRLAQTMSPRSPRRLILERDWRLLKAYEGNICRTFDGLLAVSEEDRAALEEAAGRSLDTVVIPIAIDTDEVPLVSRQPGANHIIHIGTMYWPPNVDAIKWFIQDVLPHIRQQRPNTVFDCIGARPPQELVDLNDRGLGVNVTGYIPDPSQYLQQAGVMVVPVRAGGGIRVKILNGMSQGLPMVTTTIGCEGIAVEHGRHALIADTPQAFADAVVQVLDNRRLADELGRNGRMLAEAKYDYRAACKPMERVYGATE